MRIVAICFLLTSSLFAQDAKNLEGLESVVERCLTDFCVPGLALAIVDHDEVVYKKGFGVRDRENGLPVTEETLFPIASCTKAFCSFAFSCLADERIVKLDQPVVELVNEFRIFDPAVTQEVTFRDLFAHRTGISRHDFLWYNSTLVRKDLVDRLRFLQPSSGFRERFEYNNLAYLIAGIAMERATGKSWEQIVSEKILKPLRMKDTNFSIEALRASTNFASPYLQKNEIKRIAHRDLSLITPAAGINSSVNDMSRWVQMLLSWGVFESRSLLSSSTLNELFTVQPYSVSQETMGLGWRIDEFSGYKQVSHDGVIDGFTSLVSLLPEKGIGVVVLTNKNLCPLPRLLAMHVFDRLLGLPRKEWFQEGKEAIEKEKMLLLAEQKKESCMPRKGPIHELDEYTGEYAHPGYGVLQVGLFKGALHLFFNRVDYQLEPWQNDLFQISSQSEEMIISQVGKKVNFRVNLEGKIDEVQIAFEVETGPIIFKLCSKERKEYANSLCLKQLVGQYQIYHKVFEIVLEDQVLRALIPGGDPYELIPEGENTFSVKGQSGRKVHFVLNEQGKVKEVLLREPYGTIYTARPKS